MARIPDAAVGAHEVVWSNAELLASGHLVEQAVLDEFARLMPPSAAELKWGSRGDPPRSHMERAWPEASLRRAAGAQGGWRAVHMLCACKRLTVERMMQSCCVAWSCLGALSYGTTGPWAQAGWSRRCVTRCWAAARYPIPRRASRLQWMHRGGKLCIWNVRNYGMTVDDVRAIDADICSDLS